MARSWTLEPFDGPARDGAAGSAPSEEDRLAAFEKGYREGWEDAAAAHAKDQTRIAVELGNNLQTLSFTYHEARTALLSEMEDLLRGMVEGVLPMAVHGGLPATILDRVRDGLHAAAESEIAIVVAPDNVARVAAVVGEEPTLPVRVVGEPSLGDGQAYLRFAESEDRIDVDAALQEMQRAVESFFAEAATPDDKPHSMEAKRA